MLKNLKNKLNENKGFSLVELIVVIAIMVILIALLVPNVVGYISKAQDSANLSAAKSIYNAASTAVVDCKAQTGGYPTPAELATTLNSGTAAEKLVTVPKGTAAAIGYDGAGNVWAVVVGTDEGNVSATSKNIQAYSPIKAGNVYSSGGSSCVAASDLANIVACVSINGSGTGSWSGGTSMAPLSF